MKSLWMLLTFLICAGVCAAQEVPARRDAPPSLVILKLKWERQLDHSPDAGRPAHDGGPSAASDPDALNNPGGLQTTGRSPFLPYIYQYSVEVRNDHAKKIRWLSWDYVLSDPRSKRELGRHKFVSSEKIGPAKRKTLSGRTRATPLQVVSAERLGKDKGSVYEERVEFRCVSYDDGTWWHHPSMQESECVEAEKRGKSR
jgi:hypothetical protein